MALIQSVIEQGLIYAIMALGVYITYKILDFPDLTVDGSFPMGAAITAALISKGFNSLLTLPICFLAGALIGAIIALIIFIPYPLVVNLALVLLLGFSVGVILHFYQKNFWNNL